MISLHEIIKKSSRLLNLKYLVEEENKNEPNIRKVSNNKSKKKRPNKNKRRWIRVTSNTLWTKNN